MAEEIVETEVVAVTQTVTVVEDAAAEEMVVDWNAAPVYEETVVETSLVETTEAPTTTYFAPRGPWDFTDAQRIIIGVLLWLNILVAVTGYLALTGRLLA